MASPVHYHTGGFPPRSLEWNRLIPLIGPASAALARYDGLLAAVPNADVLLSPLTTQEAVLSSRIEGTQATMGEVLEYEAREGRDGRTKEKQSDIREVLNYRRAMAMALELMKELPLCQRVIREAHKVLLSEVRGQGRSPGEYRRVPNWIGPPGCGRDQARFIPVGADALPEAMGVWEKFLHEGYSDTLVQLALAHAEFEALHPFLDGNGRLGRMLIPLFLYQAKILSRPVFYVSAYLERNREEYYERLLAVSRDDDWTGWSGFFLRAVTEQANENRDKAQAILDLHHDMQTRMPELTHSQYASLAVDYLFRNPVFKSSVFVARAGIPEPTARRILRLLRDNEVLSLLSPASGRSSGILAFSGLLNIAEGRDVF